MPSPFTQPLNRNEADLLATYRDSLQNDRQLLGMLLAAWSKLSPAQRATLYRTADLFVSAASWRGVPQTEGQIAPLADTGGLHWTAWRVT